MNWPIVGSSPINEYNTEGLFDMAFPTLFSRGEADWLQPRMRNAHLHEYAKHLLRYRDNRFGRHPHFRYFLLNIIMRHRAQASSTIFVKKNMVDLPTIVSICDIAPMVPCIDTPIFHPSFEGMISHCMLCDAQHNLEALNNQSLDQTGIFVGYPSRKDDHHCLVEMAYLFDVDFVD
jgi:hypothetical protein